MVVQSVIPKPVFAGFFSLFSSFIYNKEVVDGEGFINLRNMALLESAEKPDSSLDIGGGNITILDDSALMPESGVYGTAADIDGIRHPSTISVYVVRSGDTLSEIATMFDVSVNTIRWANDISGSLKEGQTLIILPVSGIRYTIAKGDTLASIAKKYKGSAEEIMQFNGLGENPTLALGEILIIPDGEAPIVVSTTSSVRGTNVPAYDGYYLRPVSNAKKSQGLHGYNGIDLAAPIGTPIMAAADGTVIIARAIGWNGGYGTYIVIAHQNGTQTLYSHMSDTAVFQGEVVKQGQVIGHIGLTGKTTGPHLHFEVRGAKNPF